MSPVGGRRKRQVEPAARSGRRRDRHAAAVRLDDGLDQAEAEAEAAFGAALVAAVEPVPDARQLVGGNADAGVA